MAYKFAVKDDRTYLIQNPDAYGKGVEKGYFEKIENGYKATALYPFRAEQDCRTEAEARR
ncbi:hypothetical protein [Leptolyngbya ohadii]|uniref:hypothetical protein n=1 Tax=Leptolyngbya ohadii TaxID=1962290 RepID=UPI000B5A1D09|nr:hypothetical protein [Leptolyngbya ohadii]